MRASINKRREEMETVSLALFIVLQLLMLMLVLVPNADDKAPV
jgi:hypothetical protein